MFTLAEELFLISLEDKKDGVKLSVSDAMPYALSGALLLELALAGKVRLADKKVFPQEATPGGNPLANELLEKIAASKKVRKIEHWIGVFGEKGKKLRKGILGGLVSRGVLSEQEKRFLWVIPYTGYASQDASARFALKQELRAVVLGSAPVTERTLALLSLVRAARLEDHLFTRDELKQARRQIENMTKSEAVGEAVIAAIQAVESASAAVIVLSAANYS